MNYSLFGLQTSIEDFLDRSFEGEGHTALRPPPVNLDLGSDAQGILGRVMASDFVVVSSQTAHVPVVGAALAGGATVFWSGSRLIQAPGLQHHPRVHITTIDPGDILSQVRSWAQLSQKRAS